MVLARDGVIGLSQLDLQSLHLVFVSALLLIALYLDCRTIVLQGIAGVLVFVFQRLNVRFVLRHLARTVWHQSNAQTM